jgi:hypothetical protein
MSQVVAFNNMYQLNNSAVLDLAEGRINQAVLHLEQALQSFHQLLGLHEPQERNNSTTRTAEADIEAMPIDPQLSACDYMRSPGNAFRVYDVAFTLPMSHLHHEKAALVVLYNFGLAVLRKGSLAGSERLLRKSHKIHTMAATLVENSNFSDLSGSFYLLRLALLTNQGFLHAYFLDFEKAENCKDQVKALLLQLTTLNIAAINLTFFRQMVRLIELFGLPMNLPPAA